MRLCAGSKISSSFSLQFEKEDAINPDKCIYINCLSTQYLDLTTVIV